MMFFIGIPLFRVLTEDFTQSTSQKIRFLTSRSDDVIYRPNDQVSIASSVRTTRTFHPNLPLCREALNCSNLHPSGHFSSPSGQHSVFDQASRFLSKTQILEYRWDRPNDVDSRPDALIHKASIAFKIKTSERQSAWSGRASIRYGNCVHQINHPDDHPPGPDARSLYMEITCSRRTTVRTTGQHRPDAAEIRKDFQQNFWNFGRTVVHPDSL
jgi:hypothetical protein